MSYVIDLKDGRSFFLKLEEYEYFRITPVDNYAIVNVFEERKLSSPKLSYSFTGVEKFTLVSD